MSVEFIGYTFDDPTKEGAKFVKEGAAKEEAVKRFSAAHAKVFGIKDVDAG